MYLSRDAAASLALVNNIPFLLSFGSKRKKKRWSSRLVISSWSLCPENFRVTGFQPFLSYPWNHAYPYFLLDRHRWNPSGLYCDRTYSQHSEGKSFIFTSKKKILVVFITRWKFHRFLSKTSSKTANYSTKSARWEREREGGGDVTHECPYGHKRWRCITKVPIQFPADRFPLNSNRSSLSCPDYTAAWCHLYGSVYMHGSEFLPTVAVLHIQHPSPWLSSDGYVP